MRFADCKEVDELTSEELRKAGDDLRNAGLVVYYGGHYRGSLVDRNTGSVCLAGGIQLATSQKLQHSTVKIPGEKYHYFWHTGLDTAWHFGDLWNRAEHALIVLASTLPHAWCAECVARTEPYERITHYNDAHCVGAHMAYRILRRAAEYADDLADARHGVEAAHPVPEQRSRHAADRTTVSA